MIGIMDIKDRISRITEEVELRKEQREELSREIKQRSEMINKLYTDFSRTVRVDELDTLDLEFLLAYLQWYEDSGADWLPEEDESHRLLALLNDRHGSYSLYKAIDDETDEEMLGVSYHLRQADFASGVDWGRVDTSIDGLHHQFANRQGKLMLSITCYDENNVRIGLVNYVLGKDEDIDSRAIFMNSRMNTLLE